MTAMTTTALVNYYGTNRIGAARVGREMGPCDCACITFAGSMAEIPAIKARQFTINDVHRAAVNLGVVTSTPSLRGQLQERVSRLPFHPDMLASARRRCIEREGVWADVAAGELFGVSKPTLPSDAPDLEWAVDYFVCSWMGRGSTSGTDGEFEGGISVRFNANGGGSCVRFRSAARSLEAWEAVLHGAEFTTLDFRLFLKKCNDKPGIAIYNDPPFPGVGDQYKFKFTDEDHRDLSRQLDGFKHARIVIRYHDHPLIRELYPPARWTVLEWEGRTQTNGAAKELLILNGPSLAKGAA